MYGRDLQVSQHALDGQMSSVPVAGILNFVLFANKMGGTVVSARRCGSWLVFRQGSLDQGGTLRGESVVLLDSLHNNQKYLIFMVRDRCRLIVFRTGR